jgi:hypothetical protein
MKRWYSFRTTEPVQANNRDPQVIWTRLDSLSSSYTFLGHLANVPRCHDISLVKVTGSTGGEPNRKLLEDHLNAIMLVLL